MKLEISTDASTTTFNTMLNPEDRIFGCSGAISITTGDEEYIVSPDTTNNRSELLAVYLGLKLAKRIMDMDPERYDELIIYSDSQLAVKGLTEWIHTWEMNKDIHGVLRRTDGGVVLNQELYLCIISFVVLNKIKVSFKHVSGHINLNNPMSLRKAEETYYRMNKEFLKPEEVYKVTYYNNLVDSRTRSRLKYVNPDKYKRYNYSNNYRIMVNYILPVNYKEYIS
jgi:ribonuclease HI